MSCKLKTWASLISLSVSTTVLSAESYNCLMDPAQIIQLSAKNAGILSEIVVGHGDTVNVGQVLAKMDSSLEDATVAILEARAGSTAQIASQEARVSFVALQLDRIRRLVEQNAQSVVRLEELEYEYSIAQSALAQANDDRKTLLAEADRARVAQQNTIIASPIDGQVVDILLGEGESASPDRHIMLIAQLDPLHVDAYLPISLYLLIERGMTVTIRPDDPIGGEYEAVIAAIDNVFDAASRTFGVRVVLENRDQLLPGGHRCTMELNLES